MVLIDKAALLNKIAKEVHYDSEHSLEMYAKMLSLINDAPDRVVRCKDCKWYYILNGHNRCDLLDLEARDIKPDWFCADGERREDGNNDNN